ncbi:MAG: hypothetical protein JWN66_3086 [Sphingomonas bacterium]|nr:hypothetical protein [Sphingomonas bacterium]
MSLEDFARSLASSIPGGLLAALIALPFSPSIYALALHGDRCFGHVQPGSADGTPLCLVKFAALAPVAALMGPLAHDEGQTENIWPGIFLTALAIGMLVALIRAYRAASRSPGQG